MVCAFGAMWGADRARGAEFVAGHIYTPIDGAIVEWDQQFNLIRIFQVEGVNTSSGAVFGPNNELVFLARQGGDVKVLRVDADGQITGEYDTGHSSFLRGSYIDFNPVTQQYAFANDDRITILDADLNFVSHTMGFVFDRASGVAWGENGELYATDQLENTIAGFGSNFIHTGRVAHGFDGGMDRVGSRLWATDITQGEFGWFDLDTGSQGNLVDLSDFGEFSDIYVFADGRILTTGTHNELRMFDAFGTLLYQGGGFGGPGDGVAVFIPSPSGSLCLGALAVLHGRRNRRRLAPSRLDSAL